MLAHRVGEEFDAVVVDLNHTGGKVQLVEPAVLARAPATLRLGEHVRVRLDGRRPGRRRPSSFSAAPDRRTAG